MKFTKIVTFENMAGYEVDFYLVEFNTTEVSWWDYGIDLDDPEAGLYSYVTVYAALDPESAFTGGEPYEVRFLHSNPIDAVRHFPWNILNYFDIAELDIYHDLFYQAQEAEEEEREEMVRLRAEREAADRAEREAIWQRNLELVDAMHNARKLYIRRAAEDTPFYASDPGETVATMRQIPGWFVVQRKSGKAAFCVQAKFNGYTVTHVPTGKNVTNVIFSGVEAAVRFAAALSENWPGWFTYTGTGGDVPQSAVDFLKELSRVVRD